MQTSRTKTLVVNNSVVKPSVVPPFDARLMNGIHQGHRLPQSFYAPDIDPPSPVEKETVADQVKKAIAELLGAKGGDQMAALETLIRKNHRLEMRAEDAERERDQLKAKAPDDKSLEKLAAYEKLGAVEEIQQRIDAGAQAAARAATFERTEALKAAGYDPDKFNALQGADKWTFSEREETHDGKPVKVPLATVTDADGKEVTKPVGELVAQQFPQFADALKLAAPQQQAPPGVRYPPQDGGGKPANVNPATSHINSRYPVENLRKRTEERAA